MTAVPERALRALQYTIPPFFANPIKPWVNSFDGSAYERAYEHFRRDHNQADNLFYHMLCLVYQVGSNYGFLASLDEELDNLEEENDEEEPKVVSTDPIDRAFEEHYALAHAKEKAAKASAASKTLTALTTAAWAASLLSAPAPLSVKAASLATIAVFHQLRHRIRDNWIQLLTAQGLVEALIIQVLFRRGPITRLLNPSILVTTLLRFALQALCVRFQGALRGYRWPVNMLVIVGMMYRATGTQKEIFGLGQAGPPVIGDRSPFSLGPLLWMPAVLTNQKWLFFFSSGFIATLNQGVAHALSGELATLPQLTNIKDDLAHTTYFPNLLLQSVCQSLTG